METRAQVEEFRRKHRTGLVTLVFTDLVDSVALRRQLGDQAGTSLLQAHRQLVRHTLARFVDAEEIETAGDSFLLLFARPSDSVKFALLVQRQTRALAGERDVALAVRMGIHVGEVVIEEHARGPKPKDLYGSQIDLCARVMGLAESGQVLLTRAVFDSARQAIKGEDIEGVKELSWLNHGPYLLKGIEESVEVCEVGEVGVSPLKAPSGSEKAKRQVSPDEEPVLGWRPALGQAVPNTQWVLEKKLGEGGFGEVWLGRHQKLKERRVFKFCFRADRVRSLKREMTLFRVLKERVGDHPNIVRLLEVYFEEPPFYVVMDHVEGQDLKGWCEQQGGVEKVPLAARLDIVAQIADALQAAHDAGVIHRDVKPGNILVSGVAANWRSPQTSSPESRPPSPSEAAVEQEKSPANTSSPLRLLAKLTDFGIGQVVSEEALKGVTKAGFTETLVADSSSSHTGSQMYMAPELLAGKPASIRSDIYSLGVVLYQLLVGDLTRPVTTDWAREITDPLLRDDLAHCFAGNPNERFAGAGQLAKHLRALPERRATLEQQQAELAAREKAAYRRGMIRTATIATGVVALFALLTLFAFIQSRRAHQEARRAEVGELNARKNLYAADMVLARQALDSGNLGRAMELIEKYNPIKTSANPASDSKATSRGKPDLRGWEWRFLWQLVQSEELCTLGSHSNVVQLIAFSPDGRSVATASQDNTLKLWDVPGRREIAAIVYENAISGLAFSVDGKLLAVGTGTDVRSYDPVTGREATGRSSYPDDVSSIAFSPDGKKLAVYSGKVVQLLDPVTRREIWRGQFPDGWRVTFSPDSRMLAIGTTQGSVILWDVVAQSQIARWPGHRFLYVGSLEFSPDGRLLAVACGGVKAALVWDLATLQLTKRVETGAGWIGSVTFSPDGKTAAISADDQTITLFDRTTWQVMRTLKGHLNEVWAAAFSPDGKMLITGSKDETVRLWDATPKSTVKDSLKLPADTEAAVFSSDAKTLIALTTNNTFTLWDTSTLTRIATQPLPDTNFVHSEFRRVAVTSGGRLLMMPGNDGKVRVWETATLREAKPYEGFTTPVSRVMLSRDEAFLVAVSFNAGVKIWETASQRLIGTFNSTVASKGGLAYSSGHKLLAFGNTALEAEVWDTATQSRLASLTGHKMFVQALAISPDGRSLVSSGPDAKVKIWDARSGELRVTLGGQLNSASALAISPDGRRLFAGGGGVIRIWDMETMQEVATLKGHTKDIIALAFLPDDETLVSLSVDSVHLWRAPPLNKIDTEIQAQAKKK